MRGRSSQGKNKPSDLAVDCRLGSRPRFAWGTSQPTVVFRKSGDSAPLLILDPGRLCGSERRRPPLDRRRFLDAHSKVLASKQPCSCDVPDADTFSRPVGVAAELWPPRLYPFSASSDPVMGMFLPPRG
jgi:hypothetical protein